MGHAFNSLFAFLLAVSAFLVFRKGHDAIFKDWRRGVLLFAVSYVLLEVAGAFQRSAILRPPW